MILSPYIKLLYWYPNKGKINVKPSRSDVKLMAKNAMIPYVPMTSVLFADLSLKDKKITIIIHNMIKLMPTAALITFNAAWLIKPRMIVLLNVERQFVLTIFKCLRSPTLEAMVSYSCLLVMKRNPMSKIVAMPMSRVMKMSAKSNLEIIIFDLECVVVYKWRYVFVSKSFANKSWNSNKEKIMIINKKLPSKILLKLFAALTV